MWVRERAKFSGICCGERSRRPSWWASICPIKCCVRARKKLKSHRPAYVAGDLMRMPFAEESFDCVTCGWVIEHLPDPRPGLMEIGRVLKPGGRALILATEDTVLGSLVSRTWKCRTYNRKELETACGECGVPWKEQLWFTKAHRFFKMGGILVEAVKTESLQRCLIAIAFWVPVLGEIAEGIEDLRDCRCTRRCRAF